MLIETIGVTQWWEYVKKHFIIEHTRLETSNNSITIYIDLKGGTVKIVAKYCKVSKVGVIMDSRKEIREKAL